MAIVQVECIGLEPVELGDRGVTLSLMVWGS